ncbi:hypothetical protein ATK74_0588 [Propionicimonas paludicola]|uniref:Uncharacterized protein n=1 Tax=Propionicimonas paludicola TaxID=185243 RepID=A0A2A9CR88_9ACTN|nr:hypothetical protein [Propionicimonas paludicola]PFG16059.1 hypothetical protein ATK74_0588 [Propionicimonas paludicola]
MRLSNSATERLLAGDPSADQADLATVAAFLSDLPKTLPPAEVGDVREAHLDAITREARIVAAAAPPRARRSTRRLVVTAVAAGLGVLTTGVGVAAAVGANPLGFLPNLLPIPASSVRVDHPASLEPSAHEPSGPPVPPPPTHSPQSTGAPGQPAGEDTPGGSQSNNGRSDEARSDHSPTAKPSHPNNGKSGEKGEHGRSEDNPGKGKPTANPGKGKPAATSEATSHARTDPPGKTTSGN